MPDIKQIILPIKGMTCANCVATIERNLKKLNGIENVAVNLSSERAAVGFKKSRVQINDIVEKIKRAGYAVAAAEGEFILKTSPDSSDSVRIRRALEKIEGMLIGSSQVVEKLREKGIINRSTAVSFGVSGPNLRASGIRSDLRRKADFLLYKDVSFTIPLGKCGDCLDRFAIRFKEIYQSIKIISQIVDRMPPGAIRAGFPWYMLPFPSEYSYDITVSDLSNASGGAHEISMGLKFNCPQKRVRLHEISCPSF